MSDAEPDPKTMMFVIFAAMFFSTAETATDDDLEQSFDRAERFVAAAVKRYGDFVLDG